jgi:uncharacterized protein YndB with AHSA1/START domain
VRITLAGERTGQVEACEPPQRLLLTMNDPDPQPGQPEQTVIEAQLIAEGAQTRLVWEERGMPVNLPRCACCLICWQQLDRSLWSGC